MDQADLTLSPNWSRSKPGSRTQRVQHGISELSVSKLFIAKTRCLKDTPIEATLSGIAPNAEVTLDSEYPKHAEAFRTRSNSADLLLALCWGEPLAPRESWIHNRIQLAP